MPPLKALLEKEKAKTEKHTEVNRSLGFSQAFEYGKRSNEEYVLHSLVC
jgi:nucleoporin NUP82